MMKPSEIRKRLENGDMTVQEWVECVFADEWTKKFKKINGSLPGEPNSRWNFLKNRIGWKVRNKIINNQILEDQEWLDGLTKQYGLRYSFRNGKVDFALMKESKKKKS